METYQIISESEGFVILSEGEKIMSMFGEIPMWFESETEARNYWTAHTTNADKVRSALQSLKSNLHFNTGDPMHINQETITDLLNGDALFYPYAGPERVDQAYYFQPLRNFLEQVNFAWMDVERAGLYSADESLPILRVVEALSMSEKSKLFYLLINTQDLFIAPLAYLKGSITEEEFLQVWLYTNGVSTKPKSKAYAELKNLLDSINKSF